MELRNLPTRVATGGYILHSGLDTRRADQAAVEKVHAMAVAGAGDS